MDKARLLEQLARIDALTLQERVLVLLATVLVFYALWHYALMQPLVQRQTLLSQQLEQNQLETEGVNEQSRRVIERSQQDPDAANRRRVTRLRTEIEELDERLAGMTQNLIPPKDMARVLETVLVRSAGLRVRELRGLGASSLLETAGGASAEGGEAGGDTPAARAYKHGVRIEFSGSYLDALGYLRELEALPYAFFWDRIELEVQSYPRARTAIVVYTLSLDRRWIGV